MTDAPDWARLGEKIVERRGELRLTQAEIRAAGGPSGRTLQLLEHGSVTSVKRHTKTALEDALRWERGSVDAVLAGGEPRPVIRQATGGGRVEVLHEEPGERILISIMDGVGELSTEERRHILALIRSMQAAKQSSDKHG